ncbi:MAG: valine--tRNA ligase [Christensenellales bacterium]
MPGRKEMEKVYDPALVEERLYGRWEERGYFHAEPDPGREPFTVVIPPPNITGQLHMGHALDNTMQDAIIRFRRMQGYCTLWMPGTDHASIATELKIVEQLSEEGLQKDDVGREGFLKRAWEWKRTYGSRIVLQLKKLGASCDWARERFTMDEGCIRAVNEAFVDLYEKGLIYRGDRIINWCPDCCTALSDTEVEHEERETHLWHVRYPEKGGGEGVVVATTRPETMLGDTGVAVNPKDERYRHLIGKTLVLPLLDREIPVVADEYVDMEFGTGAVKMTPAHDPNDFEVGMRHGLETIRVLDDTATVNENGGPYAGLDRYEARKRIEADLDALGLLVKKEKYSHSVGHCYRCQTLIEPIVSKQWFVSMKPLAVQALEAVNDGAIRFIPGRFARVYRNWMENVRDWCISRQLWWGHRIPAYYCDGCEEVIVSKSPVAACPSCGGPVRQDEDVLDTWFSSGLWPFSTMGWPDKTPELEYFYPTSVLVTAYDIIFFWVARMIVFGFSQMGEKPFGEVLIHGIVRDEQGRKMSKSLGNGIDPLEVIDRYGADALRFSLVNGTSPGNDMRFSWARAEAARNFANKLWNAARFVLMNAGEETPALDPAALDAADKWILTRLQRLVPEITGHLEKYELGMAAQKLYDFIWSEYCDWYIEMAKARLYGKDEKARSAALSVLAHVLSALLKMLHPFMPFITEEIFLHLPGTEGTIMTAPWPEADEALTFICEAGQMAVAMEAIKAVRNVRAEMNVPPSARPRMVIVAKDPGALAELVPYIEKLAGAGGVSLRTDRAGAGEKAVALVCGGCEVFIPLAELVDVDKERERLSKEVQRLISEIDRARAKLDNRGFVEKAPAAVVEAEREKAEKFGRMLDTVRERLEALEG